MGNHAINVLEEVKETVKAPAKDGGGYPVILAC
jgi:hypothetical protein